jgi:hypothetical protein
MSSSSSVAGTLHTVAGRRRHLLVGSLVLLIAVARKVITPAAATAIQTGIDDIRAAVQWQAGVTNP